MQRFNPKKIEDFLMNQEHVLDASVWVDRGEVTAHVTAEPGAHLDERTILTRCVASMGVEHSPKTILVIQGSH